jgi:SAM-dependent methyltransferase
VIVLFLFVYVQTPFNFDYAMNMTQHYEKLLAPIYDWMTGDFKTEQQKQEDFLKSVEVEAKGKATAVDLGAGHGLQTISLAHLGYAVVAIDSNQLLLDKIPDHPSVRKVWSDLLDVSKYTDEADVIVCMGDTIAHLTSFDELRRLFQQCRNVLTPGGRLILTYRDYTNELIGEERFIPVRSDEEKILTCLLEYQENKVKVTDILYEKVEGRWKLNVSSYMKLRITKTIVERLLLEAGFSTESHGDVGRMLYEIARKRVQ